MAHRFDPKSSPRENLQLFVRSIPLKMLVLLPLVLVILIPTYIYVAHAGSDVLPSVTDLFYQLSNVSNDPTPTPMPAYPTVLPRVGSIAYTIQEGDNCDEVLATQMNMDSASEVFSDANSVTVKALNKTMGVDCHKIQPGMTVKMSPQYPLMALGGVVTKISGQARQVLPTPLIPVQNQQDQGPDCSQGCQLTVRIANGVQVNVNVSTTLTLKTGAWIWAQAQMQRQSVKSFSSYPYVDPNASLNGTTLRACDFQVNDTHDDNSDTCGDLEPNTISSDGGSWLVGVVGQAGLNHWHYRINAPTGTQILLWLTADSNGNLTYHAGNPIYRYDASSKMYVKL